mgnify:CR=1 FL=1
MNESVLSFKDKYFGDKNFYKMTLTIAVPIIIQNLLTNLVSMADNIMVGQLGTNQMSGVAIINQLFFVFNLRFNPKLHINELENNENLSENIKYYNDIMDQFSDVPEDLFIFFHAIENGRCFMTTQYYNPYKEQFTTTYNFKFLLSELADKERLKERLIRFYFYDLQDEEVEACMRSNTPLFSHIKKSSYSGEEKSKLYEFFIDPEPYIQTLRYELMAKEIMLTQYYEKNYQKILEVFNQTTFEILNEINRISPRYLMETVKSTIILRRTIWSYMCPIV